MATGTQWVLKFTVMMGTSGIITQTGMHMFIFGIFKRSAK